MFEWDFIIEVFVVNDNDNDDDDDDDVDHVLLNTELPFTSSDPFVIRK